MNKIINNTSIIANIEEKNLREDALLGSFFTKEEVEKRREKIELDKDRKAYKKLFKKYIKYPGVE